MKRFLILVPLFLLGGCLAIDCGYAPNVEVAQAKPLPAAEKVPITFSVSCECPLLESPCFAPTPENMRERIQEALEATGLFSDVRYAAVAPAMAYHIAFFFHLGGVPAETEVALGTLSGASLLLIPVWTWLTLDGCAEVSLRGERLYSWASAEKLCMPIWLPLAPVGLFWNCKVGWDNVTQGVINGMANEFSAFHQARFLNK